MNEVNKTLFIPLYGKAQVSKKNIILKDAMAEKIWEAEKFPIYGKSKSKWLAYNMAMRARVFDDWTDLMLAKNRDALVLHIGCGLDSRYERVKEAYQNWYDCDLPDVIEVRHKYYREMDNYHMKALDATDLKQIKALPDSEVAIVILEGISMYLTHEQLQGLFMGLQEKYSKLFVLMDIYTEFAAKASKYKNPVNEVGVTKVYGIDDIDSITIGSKVRFKEEHSLTPMRLVEELKPFEKAFFKLMFNGRIYGKIYRLLEFESERV